MNRCLDNAIAEAVMEFGFQKDALIADVHASDTREKMGYFAHELRNLLGTASLAFSAAKQGNLSLSGATGTILERSLSSLEKLITTSLEEVRAFGLSNEVLDAFSLDELISEIDSAALSATIRGCTLRVAPVDPTLALNGTRDLLIAAVANLLQNAFKFTQPGTEIVLTAYASGNRIHIDVQDHCGGLGVDVADTVFSPVTQGGTDRSGIGLGLTIARQSITADGGELTVRNIAGKACVFMISLARHKMPT
ncbi:sensor histidine kinase [Massilia scottii]|uniref:sensor histidine kinase n=1 Tax=Massilia scottii TaxID=3057166 RepID=UPI0027967F9A|nr:HAMP domain-containing sensor histidine kinase [Massilia sp. CCM 9029]MDQ1833598.1 HAMP domain-containing sensor histidine kinase [Massilia sp. CCM 9029]